MAWFAVGTMDVLLNCKSPVGLPPTLYELGALQEGGNSGDALCCGHHERSAGHQLDVPGDNIAPPQVTQTSGGAAKDCLGIITGAPLLQVTEEVVAQSAVAIMEEFLDTTRQFDTVIGLRSTASERATALFGP